MADDDRLVTGADVWQASEIEGHADLRRELSPEELSELEAADESCPHLQARGAELRETLEQGPGIVRLRGVRVDDQDEAVLSRMLLRFARSVGTPVSQNVEGDRIYRVADAGLAAADSRARGPNSRNALTFHSDRADVIGFLCVRPASEGGESIVVSAGAIHNEIARTRPDLLSELYRPFYWQRHNIDTANELPWYRMPVFAREGGGFAITLMQVLIERAHRSEDLPDLSSAQREALVRIQELASDPAFQLRFRQEPGELLLLNNYVTLHSRTAFSDPPGAPGRLILRGGISVPNSRQLPESWAAHYGGYQAGAVRGGIREARPKA
jgi:alpha-ketoglutarate-dependent taurine dioxygenase